MGGTVNSPEVIIVDDDASLCKALKMFFDSEDIPCKAYYSGEEFLDKIDDHSIGCVLLDMCMPGMDGLQVHVHLKDKDNHYPTIFMTGHGDVSTAVRAMKSGAYDFIEKPVNPDLLLERVQYCMRDDVCRHINSSRISSARSEIELLTPREREVMDMLLHGYQNKQIAYKLGISPRTVELHRANIMSKLSAKSLPDAIRIGILASM